MLLNYLSKSILSRLKVQLKNLGLKFHIESVLYSNAFLSLFIVAVTEYRRAKPYHIAPCGNTKFVIAAHAH